MSVVMLIPVRMLGCLTLNSECFQMLQPIQQGTPDTVGTSVTSAVCACRLTCCPQSKPSKQWRLQYTSTMPASTSCAPATARLTSPRSLTVVPLWVAVSRLHCRCFVITCTWMVQTAVKTVMLQLGSTTQTCSRQALLMLSLILTHLLVRSLFRQQTLIVILQDNKMAKVSQVQEAQAVTTTTINMHMIMRTTVTSMTARCAVSASPARANWTCQGAFVSLHSCVGVQV